MDQLFDQTISQIQSTPLTSDPFIHLMMEQVFPAELYAQIISNLPETFYYQNSKAYPQRYSFTLNEDNLNLLALDPKLHAFWSRFAEGICSAKFLSAILKKFGLQENGPYKSIVHLMRDRDHYSIGPHTDIPEKVITLLFYLPTSGDQIHLGTSLYRPIDPTFTCSGNAHHPFEPFKKVGQAPFLPNSVFGFLRSDTSFHGVEPIGVQEKERNLLGFTVWK